MKKYIKAGKSAIAEHDMFGHVVNLNFDQRGDSHKTICGGSGSICIKVFLTFYIYLNVTKLIFKENDTNLSTIGLLELDKEGTIPYDKMDMKFFHPVRKQNKASLPKIDGVDSFKKYFTVKYLQQNNDWYKMEFPEIEIPTKDCTQEDFGEGEDNKKIFDSWAGFTLICPDFSKTD